MLHDNWKIWIYDVESLLGLCLHGVNFGGILTVIIHTANYVTPSLLTPQFPSTDIICKYIPMTTQSIPILLKKNIIVTD